MKKNSYTYETCTNCECITEQHETWHKPRKQQTLVKRIFVSCPASCGTSTKTGKEYLITNELGQITKSSNLRLKF